MTYDTGTLISIAGILVSVSVAVIAAFWGIVRKQGERTDRAVEALSARLDAKFEKHLAALTSVQEVAGESMRRVLSAWTRIDEESRLAAHEREERARLQEQMAYQKEIIAELKRTQELNLEQVRRAVLEHRNP